MLCCVSPNAYYVGYRANFIRVIRHMGHHRSMAPDVQGSSRMLISIYLSLHCLPVISRIMLVIGI